MREDYIELEIELLYEWRDRWRNSNTYIRRPGNISYSCYLLQTLITRGKPAFYLHSNKQVILLTPVYYHRIKLVSCYKILILYNTEGNVNSIINPNCKVYYMLLNIIATEYSLFFVKLWYSNICNQINYGIRYNAGKPIE